MKKIPVLVLAALSSIIFFNACNIDNDNNTNPQTGYVLFANLSPDATPLTVNVNGSQVGDSALKYGQYTPYNNAVAGTYSVSVYGSASSPVVQTNFTVNPQTVYSYFLIDSFSRIKSSLVQDVIYLASPDSAYIRFFNFSPNAGALTLVDATYDTTLYNTRTFNDQGSTTSYTSFSKTLQGSHDYELREPDGTVVATKTINLEGTHTYTLLAKGNLNGTGDQALGLGYIINN